MNTTIDPSVGTATDLDGGGKNDYFLTFSVLFSDVVIELANRGITNVNEDSLFSYVVATATQANSLNQDLNGVGKTYDPAATYSTLGVASDLMSANGMAVVPEANPAFVVVLLAAAAAAARHLSVRRASGTQKAAGRAEQR